MDHTYADSVSAALFIRHNRQYALDDSISDRSGSDDSISAGVPLDDSFSDRSGSDDSISAGVPLDDSISDRSGSDDSISGLGCLWTTLSLIEVGRMTLSRLGCRGSDDSISAQTSAVPRTVAQDFQSSNLKTTSDRYCSGEAVITSTYKGRAWTWSHSGS